MHARKIFSSQPSGVIGTSLYTSRVNAMKWNHLFNMYKNVPKLIGSKYFLKLNSSIFKFLVSLQPPRIFYLQGHLKVNV